MPIYEYECTSCGHRFEKMVKIGAEPPPCPECTAQVRKLISQSAFILKGGGWYKDHYGLKSDSGGDSSKPGSTKETPAAEKSDAPKADAPAAKSESATTESKPAAPATPSTTAAK